jgi:wyosine [tRNA(Phe)-imidazoG37] synthetase (radical SAM superfamily)
MATFLFNEIIFGPVKSRRLGVSLGVNLLPLDKKYCNFDCIYCECGWTCNNGISPNDLPERSKVAEKLEAKITEMVSQNGPPDVITFAGNGEPTLHPDFEGIIEDALQIRKRLCPGAEVAVLSNAFSLEDPGVREALSSIEQNILKLDTAIEETYRLINRPAGSKTISQIIDQLSRFEGDMIIQSLFFRGKFKDQQVDNTAENELIKLFEAYRAIGPASVMVYTFDRDTPTGTLEKVPVYELEAIARLIEQLGIPADVYG